MPYYFVNKQLRDGDHEVHEKDSDCGHFPDEKNRHDLGWHSDCHGAVTEAKKSYTSVNGCYYCCNACHTG